MPHARSALGAQGESLVAAHLESQGFVVLARNARVVRLELDLIARRGSLLAICEVRTRASRELLDPIVTIDRKKRERVRRAAAHWVVANGYEDHEIRLDAASVILNQHEQTVAYYEDAF